MFEPEFQAVLAEHSKDYREAEVFTSWTPPEGHYTGIVSKVRHGVRTDDDGTTSAYIALDVTIEGIPNDPSTYHGKVASLFYTTKALGRIKQDAAVLKGEPVDDINEAFTTLANSLGWVIEFDVEERHSKKYDRKFTNINISNVLDRSSVAPSNPEEA